MNQKTPNSECSSIGMADLEHITRLRNDIAREVQGLHRELEVVKKSLDQKEDQVKYLDRFLNAAGIEIPVGLQPENRSRSRDTDWTAILDIAEEILRERNGDHMSFRAMYVELNSRGVEIDVKQPEARLTQALSNDERFVRPFRKGHYALRIDHPDARNVGERKTRRNPQLSLGGIDGSGEENG